LYFGSKGKWEDTPWPKFSATALLIFHFIFTVLFLPGLGMKEKESSHEFSTASNSLQKKKE